MKISEEKLHPFVLAFEVNRDFSQYYTCHTRKRFAKQKCKSDDQPIVALRDVSLESGSRDWESDNASIFHSLSMRKIKWKYKKY